MEWETYALWKSPGLWNIKTLIHTRTSSGEGEWAWLAACPLARALRWDCWKAAARFSD